ncbi:hypothetical protein ATJ88_3008 [Isoptericola jiangsuensis]|uniref:DUF4064 domain-containing protein n=1 Tax=Isoptericola jiangsuensis TaxID=548579 RepID=A0A2A9F0H6_9MICO|nr:hypothetical protein [Isoptericola jiangsuensis]PFG44286.1 hypothetical protein ATJ88_3008 [Isoptericola jiangsuensis]
MSTAVRTAAPAEAGAVDRPPRRTVEVWSAAAGMVLTTVLAGGFALVVNAVDEQTFADSLLPALRETGTVADGVALDAAFTGARTLAAWFGFTVVTVLLLGAIGIFLARRRPRRRGTGWWFLAAGLVCLVGSQLVLYPVAFLFFVSAGLFALRKPDPGSNP